MVGEISLEDFGEERSKDETNSSAHKEDRVLSFGFVVFGWHVGELGAEPHHRASQNNKCSDVEQEHLEARVRNQRGYWVHSDRLKLRDSLILLKIINYWRFSPLLNCNSVFRIFWNMKVQLSMMIMINQYIISSLWCDYWPASYHHSVLIN